MYTGVLVACYWRATGVLLARYWRATGAILACYWRDTGAILACYWRATGPILARYWRDTGLDGSLNLPWHYMDILWVQYSSVLIIRGGRDHCHGVRILLKILIGVLLNNKGSRGVMKLATYQKWKNIIHIRNAWLRYSCISWTQRFNSSTV